MDAAEQNQLGFNAAARNVSSFQGTLWSQHLSLVNHSGTITDNSNHHQSFITDTRSGQQVYRPVPDSAVVFAHVTKQFNQLNIMISPHQHSTIVLTSLNNSAHTYCKDAASSKLKPEAGVTFFPGLDRQLRQLLEYSGDASSVKEFIRNRRQLRSVVSQQ